jgi:predicted nucleic acid-binding protein
MIVIDINAFSSVFEPKSADYKDFCIIAEWVLKEKTACFVYGGTKYKEELRKAKKYLKLLKEFKNKRKLREVNGKLTDEYERKLYKLNSDTSFNDKHLAAIINISGCRLLCTKDTASIPYLKNKAFYADSKVPKLYTGIRNNKLLNKRNIVSLKNII